jgi:hypothetical protein
LRRSREGALFGLGELGDVTAVPTIVNAARPRRVGRYVAATVVASLGAATEDVLAWLDSGDAELRGLAVDFVDARTAQEDGIIDAALARAAQEAVLQGLVSLSPTRRARLLQSIKKVLAGP